MASSSTAAAATPPSTTAAANNSSTNARRWLPINNPTVNPNKNVKPIHSFSVCSYNLLAQALVNRESFPYASNKALKQSHRNQILAKELFPADNNASSSIMDIFCFQEVDYENYHKFLLPLLRSNDYSAVYSSKRADAKHGLAIAYDNTKFRVKAEETIFFDAENKYVEHSSEINWGNIAQLVVLQFKSQEEIARDSTARELAKSVQNHVKQYNQKQILINYRKIRAKYLKSPANPQVQELFDNSRRELTKFLNVELNKPENGKKSFDFSADEIELINIINERAKAEAEEELKQNSSPNEAEKGPNQDKTSEYIDCGVIISNIHAFWNPKYNFTRLNQCFTLLSRLSALQSATNSPNYATISCGDFNLTPQTIIYKFLTGHRSALLQQIHSDEAAKVTSLTHTDYFHEKNHVISRYFTPSDHNSETQRGVEPILLSQEQATVYFDHNSELNQARINAVQQIYCAANDLPRLISVYSAYKGIIGDSAENKGNSAENEPEFTNFTEKFKGTLDYIFLNAENYEKSPDSKKCRLVARALLEIPTSSELSSAIALPNEEFSSDHIAIAAKFDFYPSLSQ
jgi:mRNA deadenylase 3'-5' endonuclease subunit Ccr4